MTLKEFLLKLDAEPDLVDFTDTIDVIEDNYHFTPSAFKNGNLTNEVNQNNGSCKIFAFGLLNALTEQQTLACFGDYYRNDVLANPGGNDHQNIRNFMASGWSGIKFETPALTLK